MVVLVAGASGGFGSVLARHLATQGMTVYGTCRTPDPQTELPFTMLAMEIGDPASVRSCVDQVIEREGRLDAVVNCVNEMFIGAYEEQTVDEVRALYDTNVFGTMAIFQAALPQMRRQGSGKLVAMSSLGGLLAVPTMSAYTSAKSALEAMSEALHHELRGTGIEVVILQPVAMHMDRPSTGSHLRLVDGVGEGSASHRMLRRMDKDTQASKLTPEKVAERVHRALLAKSNPLRVPMDRARALGMVKRLAPQAMIDRLLAGLAG